MTPDYYAYSHSNMTNVPFAAGRNIYIFTMFSFVPMVETTFGQTFWPSASNAMTGITSVVRTATALV